MENKTKDSQIHATGGSVKKLQHTPTQCRPHAHTQLHINVNAQIQMVAHKERQLDTHIHKQTDTHVLGTYKTVHAHLQIQWPRRLLLKISDFFPPLPFLQQNHMGNGKRKSAAEVQVIFIFIHQGSSLSLQTALLKNIRWWVGSACYSQLQASHSLRY